MTTDRCPPPDEEDRDTDIGDADQGVPASFAARLEHLVDLGQPGQDGALPSPRETDDLRRLLRDLKLPDWETLHARASARPSDVATDHSGGLRLFLHRLLVVSKRLSLAHAHGEFSEGERTKIRAMARALEIDDAHVDALEGYYRSLQVGR